MITDDYLFVNKYLVLSALDTVVATKRFITVFDTCIRAVVSSDETTITHGYISPELFEKVLLSGKATKSPAYRTKRVKK